MSFHFPLVFPLICDRSVWHQWKAPRSCWLTEIDFICSIDCDFKRVQKIVFMCLVPYCSQFFPNSLGKSFGALLLFSRLSHFKGGHVLGQVFSDWMGSLHVILICSHMICYFRFHVTSSSIAVGWSEVEALKDQTQSRKVIEEFHFLLTNMGKVKLSETIWWYL